ncbi:hypothetical protein G647_08228 [Cladophialophora carrionii CBS 160.54]|uniref:Srp40 C-terminal domain-containing protein n=1 Tax=Cladophialophora carrionii CBS 160.54 TaxID=1279043 RepID=V9CZV9_9EURO|nr:uncharacterized protein G647_08228 [Cladophialophora carrionii CBS 160.54]ETI20194.1 hypothetical protein G647_08228 [Cladophialophora carrionii CBS 160.54]
MVSKTEGPQATLEPSSQVLSLVAAFLNEHGFESTYKALRKELKRKNHTADLEALESGFSLEDIVKSWKEQETQGSTSDDDTPEESDASSSESESDSSSDASDQSSSSESTSESETDSESREEATKTKPSKVRRAKPKKREASPSSSSSSSDSDADDENEDGRKVKPARKNSPAVIQKIEPVRSLKRKAASSSSDSESSSSVDRSAKRTKVANGDERSSSDSGGSSASSEEETSSTADTSSAEEEPDDNEDDTPTQLQNLAKKSAPAAVAPSDSSSNTVMGDVVERSEEDSHLAHGRGGKQSVARKTHVGARPTPLAQLSAQSTASDHISNAYKSYEYADRAYNDLSVTRGKGFTKEKNKKKRGSYRGGAIDISGGKSFKFED